jgi:hypothetical protein
MHMHIDAIKIMIKWPSNLRIEKLLSKRDLSNICLSYIINTLAIPHHRVGSTARAHQSSSFVRPDFKQQGHFTSNTQNQDFKKLDQLQYLFKKRKKTRTSVRT